MTSERPEAQRDSNGPPAMPLRQASQGQTVRLAEIRGGKRLQHRLAEMGLTPDAAFTIVNHGHPGPFIIQIKETRLVLGRGMSHRIFVRPVSE